MKCMILHGSAWTINEAWVGFVCLDWNITATEKGLYVMHDNLGQVFLVMLFYKKHLLVLNRHSTGLSQSDDENKTTIIITIIIIIIILIIILITTMTSIITSIIIIIKTLI